MLGCGEGKYSVYCQALSKGEGGKLQIHSQLVSELFSFFRFFFFTKGEAQKLGLVIACDIF